VRRRAPSVIALVVLAAATLLICAPGAHAQDDAPVTMHATVDGHDVSIAASAEPIPLYPDRTVDVAVDVANHGKDPIEIASVQLVGRVLGLTFFSFATGVQLTVAPGASSTVHYQLDLTDLKHQATGLIETELVVRNHARDAVAVVHMVADVRGSLWSVYGLLGLALLVLTALAIVDAAIAIRRHKMSQNRWRRGLRLLTPGIGIGLVLAFTASVARWWVPSTGLWLLVAAITAATFFALGYFSPTPEADDDEDEDVVHVASDEETAGMGATDADKTAVIPAADADDTVVDDTR
jgi:hypothetical protein